MKLPILFLATLATFLCVENVSAQWLRGRFGSAELEEMMRDVEKDIVKIKALLQKKNHVFFTKAGEQEEWVLDQGGIFNPVNYKLHIKNY